MHCFTVKNFLTTYVTYNCSFIVNQNKTILRDVLPFNIEARLLDFDKENYIV